MRSALTVMLWIAGCGGSWSDDTLAEVHAEFPLECGHAVASCDACHSEAGPFVAVDTRCVTCHEAERPASHDPVETASCEQCHQACGWDAVSGHPQGFEAASAHGVAFNVQDPTEGDCRECHGETLTGGSASGCDDCHASAGHAGWRAECTFCHGGASGDAAGMPPHDIDGTSDPTRISFPEHAPHADNNTHPAYGCDSCHGTATLAYSDAVTDVDHVYDPSPGRSEVTFSGGTYEGGTCTVDCHGNGERSGSVGVGDGPQGCSDCHAIPPTGSENHRDHDHDRVSCDWCHDSVAGSSSNISAPDLHVDSTVQVVLSADARQWGMTYTGGRCDGECHVGGEDENHTNEAW